MFFDTIGAEMFNTGCLIGYFLFLAFLSLLFRYASVNVIVVVRRLQWHTHINVNVCCTREREREWRPPVKSRLHLSFLCDESLLSCNILHFVECMRVKWNEIVYLKRSMTQAFFYSLFRLFVYSTPRKCSVSHYNSLLLAITNFSFEITSNIFSLDPASTVSLFLFHYISIVFVLQISTEHETQMKNHSTKRHS